MSNGPQIPARFAEIRPGADAIRYLFTYGPLTLLARKAAHRPQRMFVEIASNIDRHILSEGVFERGVIDLIRAVAERTNHLELLIDVGANIGNHTVSLAPAFQRVEAVEPHPVLFRILEANALYNGRANVTCHNFGLASEDASGTLVESVENHGLSKVRERSVLPPEVFGLSSEQFGTEHEVELRDARAFVSTFGDQLDRAFIKVDVEGMELEIVSALLPLLERQRPIIGFEWFTQAQPEFRELVARLPNYELWGARLDDVGRNRAWRAFKLLFSGRSYHLERLDPDRLEDFYPLALLVPAGAGL
jgi:FkbM family methyltransferase